MMGRPWGVQCTALTQRRAELSAIALIASIRSDRVAALGTFSRGFNDRVCVGPPVLLQSHTVMDPGRVGVMTHLWHTGSSQEDLAAMGVRLVISYRFDDEHVPSLAFDPVEASGQFFGAVQVMSPAVGAGARNTTAPSDSANVSWSDGTRWATSNTSMFSAGDKMGKNALTEGWYNNFQLPFNRSVEVTAQYVSRDSSSPSNPSLCGHLYAMLRGHEVSIAASPAPIVLPSGMAIPYGARMELQHTDVVASPNAFVPLANVSAGREGVLFMVALGLTASPPWGTLVNGKLTTTNNYVEGCWHLMRTTDEALPGQVLGTGLEDFFDSAYGFSIVAPGYNPAPPGLYPGYGSPEVVGAPFQHPSSGILHFSANYTDNSSEANESVGSERFSAYRFLDAEVIGFDDGGSFGWDNGCAGYITWPSVSKCGQRPLPPPPSSSSPPSSHTSAPTTASSEAKERVLLQRATLTDAPPAKCKTYPTHVRAAVWLYSWPKP